MPETINGKPYQFTNSSGWGRIQSKFSENNALEKIYFESYGSKITWNSGLVSNSYDEHVFNYCKALKKVVINADYVNFKNRIGNNEKDIVYLSDIPVYTNYDNTTVFLDENGIETKCFVIYGKKQSVYLANVEFMLNYDDAPHGGYYWIDDIEDGEKLEVIPPDPTREGYTFGGWYCEKECINQFDFNSTFNKEELIYRTIYKSKDGKEYKIFPYPDDYVTYIYAKWIEE